MILFFSRNQAFFISSIVLEEYTHPDESTIPIYCFKEINSRRKKRIMPVKMRTHHLEEGLILLEVNSIPIKKLFPFRRLKVIFFEKCEHSFSYLFTVFPVVSPDFLKLFFRVRFSKCGSGETKDDVRFSREMLGISLWKGSENARVSVFYEECDGIQMSTKEFEDVVWFHRPHEVTTVGDFHKGKLLFFTHIDQNKIFTFTSKILMKFP